MTGTDRLVLGTVQLGMPYGIANRDGQPDSGQAEAILQEAWQGGIRTFDTAQAYGDSEAVLGRLFTANGIGREAKIITKLNPQIDYQSRAALSDALEGSLFRLGVPKLHGLMLHRETLLDLWRDGLGEVCRGFVRSGLVDRLGASVYSPERAIQALYSEGIDFVQVPTNIFDRRFERDRIFSIAARVNKQVFIRSVFLQGLLLMDPKDLPVGMDFAESALAALSRLAGDIEKSIPEIAIAFVRDSFPQAQVVFGVETAAQVRENLDWWHLASSIDLSTLLDGIIEHVDEILINPALWS